MFKTKDNLSKEYDWGISFLEFYINNSFMGWYNDPACPYKNYADLAKAQVDDYLNRGQEAASQILWEVITDFQTMAEKDLDSWEVIGDAVNTGLYGKVDAKEWLEDEVIPALLSEAKGGGWKKTAEVCMILVM